ncbi:MAG: hypothetical protein ACRDPW_07440 [Mycobacteriales bacterium]
MVTVRPRHTITETNAVARAIDRAAQRWPDERGSRARLLHRLIEEGEQAITEHDENAARARRQAIERTGGALTGVYGDSYLDRLRQDWPQ